MIINQIPELFLKNNQFFIKKYISALKFICLILAF